jgi:hypothetical protein
VRNFLSHGQREVIFDAIKAQAVYTMYYNGQGNDPLSPANRNTKWGYPIKYLWEEYLCREAMEILKELK